MLNTILMNSYYLISLLIDNLLCVIISQIKLYKIVLYYKSIVYKCFLLADELQYLYEVIQYNANKRSSCPVIQII